MAKDFRRLAVVKGLEKVSQSDFQTLYCPLSLKTEIFKKKTKIL